MHSWSSSDPPGFYEARGKVQPIYAHYIIGQGKAKLRISVLISVFHHLPSIGPNQLCALALLGSTSEAHRILKVAPLLLLP